MRFVRRLLYSLFVRFPRWLIDVTLGETVRRSSRALDRSMRRAGPWLVGIAALGVLHATGTLEPLFHSVLPFLSEILTLVIMFVVLRYVVRALLKKGGKR